MAQIASVRRLAFDAGWARWGWPERVGGFGGSTLLRAYLSEAVTARDLVEPGLYSMPEVLSPSVITFARPELAATMLPPLLRGDEVWCQGFSEPGSGSNPASLTCRAVRVTAGRGRDGWRVTGQKVWTSLSQYAQRSVLLTRTGPAESAHKGITALFVDMNTPGITIRPIETTDGEQEFSELFFDDVFVPMEPRSARKARAGRWPWMCSRTSGAPLGAGTSIDKVLLATAEQALFDLVAEALPAEVTIGDDPRSKRWRAEFLYSRRVDLRGHCRDPAQRHRPTAARFGERPLIEGEDLELFRQSLQRAAQRRAFPARPAPAGRAQH